MHASSKEKKHDHPSSGLNAGVPILLSKVMGIKFGEYKKKH